ncbi:MAG: diguanylate cyclase [Chloroflexi bacterium]|nr:diguanylate cyclase [Chloroflexota bacterium]
MKKDDAQGMTLYSWDVFKILLDYEVNRSQRYPNPLTLLDMSIEPQPNTPEIVKAAETNIAVLLNSRLRSADIPAHFKEDYFVLLPITDEPGGRAVCERMLSIFKGPFATEHGEPYTLSVRIGLTTSLGGSNLSAEVLIQQASSALKNALSQSSKLYVSYSDLH